MIASGLSPQGRAAFAALALSAVMWLPATEARACACCGTYKVVGVADWDVLNVRSGPGTRFRAIDALEPGEGCVIPTGERKGNWVRIEAHGGSGWAHRRYLTVIR